MINVFQGNSERIVERKKGGQGGISIDKLHIDTLGGHKNPLLKLFISCILHFEKKRSIILHNHESTNLPMISSPAQCCLNLGHEPIQKTAD